MVLGAALLGTAWWLYPDRDNAPEIAGQYLIESPSAIIDSRGTRAVLKSVAWIESHGTDPTFAYFTENQLLASSIAGALPPFTAGTVRALVIVGFETSDPTQGLSTPRSATAQLRLSLPAEAEVRCTGAACSRTDVPSWTSSYASRLGGFTAPSTYDVLVSHDDWDGGLFAFVLDIRGVDGLAFASTGTRTRIQYPGWAVNSPSSVPPGGFSGFVLAVGANLDDAVQYTWSEMPQGPIKGTTVGWSFRPSFEPGTGAGMPIAGVKEGVLRRDAERLFWAGITLGAAGAVALLFIQLATDALVRESRVGRERR